MMGAALSEAPPALVAERPELESSVWRGAYRLLRRKDEDALAFSYEAIHLPSGQPVKLVILAELSRGQTAVHDRFESRRARPAA